MYARLEVFTVLETVHLQLTAWAGADARSLQDPALLLASTGHVSRETATVEDILEGALVEAIAVLRAGQES